MSKLSERLRELRGSQSQAEIAATLGMKYQQWARYEKGEVAPGAELLAKICTTHAVSADWLLGIDAHSANGAPNKSVVCKKDCATCQYKIKYLNIKAITDSA